MSQMKFVNTLRKAPVRGAFFVLLMLVTLLALSALLNAADAASYRVKKVIDGDTIKLQIGDSVRFVGINTPELGHGKFKDEPLANQARRFVQRKIEGREVELRDEQPRRDKYGRRLAHIYTSAGQNMQIELLQRGLAFVVAVSDDLSYLDDYLAAEQQAQQAKKGVWGEPFYAPVNARSAVDGRKRGYQRVFGTVQRVSRSKKYQTLHLQGDFRVLISHENWQKNFRVQSKSYIGKSIETRGWIFKSHGVTGMKVTHPSMLIAKP